MNRTGQTFKSRLLSASVSAVCTYQHRQVKKISVPETFVNLAGIYSFGFGVGKHLYTSKNNAKSMC